VGRLGLGLGSGSHVVGQLGTGMRVSASFQIIPCPMSRLGLELGRRLGPGPRFVARLGSRVCRLADGGGGRGICPTPCKKEGKLSGWKCVRGECPGENVLHSWDHAVFARWQHLLMGRRARFDERGTTVEFRPVTPDRCLSRLSTSAVRQRACIDKENSSDKCK